MLKELARLSINTEGRYATDVELKFFEDYTRSIDNRISAYEKIRDSAEKIINRVEIETKNQHPHLFLAGTNDISQVCLRDMTNILRYTAAAMLLNDLDHMRDSILIWYLTIVRSFAYIDQSNAEYQILEKIVKTYLEASESQLAAPFLQLNYTILA